jgi:FMN phosphatase YigB (HAD superfamily)
MKARALVFDLFGTLVPKWPQEIGVERKRRMARRGMNEIRRHGQRLSAGLV